MDVKARDGPATQFVRNRENTSRVLCSLTNLLFLLDFSAGKDL